MVMARVLVVAVFYGLWPRVDLSVSLVPLTLQHQPWHFELRCVQNMQKPERQTLCVNVYSHLLSAGTEQPHLCPETCVP